MKSLHRHARIFCNANLQWRKALQRCAAFVSTLCAAHVLWLLCGASVVRAAEPSSGLDLPETNLWEGNQGEGFRASAQTFEASLGAGPGLAAFGSRQAHDLSLASLSYGHMLTPVVGQGHWYRGNLELRGELFGGAQFSPNTEWVVGLTPHLRYNFACGTRWVPFIDAGAGFSGTGIREPDLGGRFEFNLQACAGVLRFIRNDLALTFQVSYLHLSSASIYTPNLGANTLLGFVGITKVF